MPCESASRGLAKLASRPSIRSVPSSAARSPAMILLRVDFPAPFSPTRPCTEPGSMRRSMRSEEHTSELQSLMRNSYAVFCLKKKIETVRNQLMIQYKTNTSDEKQQ